MTGPTSDGPTDVSDTTSLPIIDTPNALDASGATLRGTPDVPDTMFLEPCGGRSATTVNVVYLEQIWRGVPFTRTPCVCRNNGVSVSCAMCDMTFGRVSGGTCDVTFDSIARGTFDVPFGGISGGTCDVTFDAVFCGTCDVPFRGVSGGTCDVTFDGIACGTFDVPFDDPYNISCDGVS